MSDFFQFVADISQTENRFEKHSPSQRTATFQAIFESTKIRFRHQV